MKKLILLVPAFLAVFVFAIALVAPVSHVEAGGFAESIVQCGGQGQPECNICDFESLIQRLMRFAIYISVLIATGLFAYAGLLMLSAGGNSGQVEKAKGIFTAVIIGFVVLLGAFLIVDTIMKAFLKGSAGEVGDFGPWNDIVCPKNFQPAAGEVPEDPAPGTGGNGGVTPTPGTGGPSPVSGTEAANRATLEGLGISINNSGRSCGTMTYQQYRAANGVGCTNVGGLTDRTISNLREIASECTGCVIQVTGGSELGHQTHSDGNRIDFNNDNAAFNNYIRSTQNPMSCIAEGGNEPHWHCTSR
jgi:hypothetical protein